MVEIFLGGGRGVVSKRREKASAWQVILAERGEQGNVSFILFSLFATTYMNNILIFMHYLLSAFDKLFQYHNIRMFFRNIKCKEIRSIFH